jgi:hypothetical protein
MKHQKKSTIFPQLYALVLLLFAMAGPLNADTLTLPFTSAATIDGSATDARFALKLESATTTSRLSTQQLLDISVSFNPKTANRGKKGSVYAVFVKNNNFFLLRPDRSFTS